MNASGTTDLFKMESLLHNFFKLNDEVFLTYLLYVLGGGRRI